MCGICGVVRTDGQEISAAALARMSETLLHRGPDDDGVWSEGGAGLASRRLSILDLSPAGHQPMASGDGRLVIVYNGELYNFRELRRELERLGHEFRSRSDTEVVVQAFAEWGAESLLRFNGMFAFAIWDRLERRLVLARDRFGVKPLYYFRDGAQLLFASEIKAILAQPGIRAAVCLPALDEYFTFQNVLSERTLFEGISILPAGHYAELKAGRFDVRRYWDYDFRNQITGAAAEEVGEEVRRLFVQAVERQLVSDVPVASYLSGGLDSGSITAVARRRVPRLMTFTAGFDLSSAAGLELAFDERAAAEFLSNQLKTEQYEMVLHAGDMEQVMPDLLWHLEDLRVGQSYPNFYVARLAGRFVKVVLSGTGGDELFGGYPWRYQHAMESGSASEFLDRHYRLWQRLVPDEEKPDLFRDDVRRRLDGHSTRDVMRGVFGAELALESRTDFLNAALYFELKTFLHGLLVVEDKVSMAHSLESRVPFLDNDLAELACRLAPQYKIGHFDPTAPAVDENEIAGTRRDLRSSAGKQVLRLAMEPILPAAVRERAKQGFSAPDASWFRGESIDYVNRLIRDKNARLYDYLQYGYVTRKLDEHGSGRHNHRLLIWSLLSFEWWLRRFLD